LEIDKKNIQYASHPAPSRKKAKRKNKYGQLQDEVKRELSPGQLSDVEEKEKNANIKILWRLLVVTAIFSVFQIIFGFLANSLSLLGDGF